MASFALLTATGPHAAAPPAPPPPAGTTHWARQARQFFQLLPLHFKKPFKWSRISLNILHCREAELKPQLGGLTEWKNVAGVPGGRARFQGLAAAFRGNPVPGVPLHGESVTSQHQSVGRFRLSLLTELLQMCDVFVSCIIFLSNFLVFTLLFFQMNFEVCF